MPSNPHCHSFHPDGGGRILVYPTANGPAKIPPPLPPGPPVVAWRWIIVCSRVRKLAMSPFNLFTAGIRATRQAFVLSAWVQSPVEQEIEYQLKRGDVVLSSGKKQVSAGQNRLMFRDRAAKAGVNEYTITIRARRTIRFLKTTRSVRSLPWKAYVRYWWSHRRGENSGLVKLLRMAALKSSASRPRNAIGRWRSYPNTPPCCWKMFRQPDRRERHGNAGILGGGIRQRNGDDWRSEILRDGRLF